MLKIRVIMIAYARTGLLIVLMMFAGTSALTGSTSVREEGNTVASKRTKNLVITITSPGGRLKGGENNFCVVFQKNQTREAVDVQNVSVEFTLLVGKIEEKPIKVKLTGGDRVGNYCGQVNLGKQYYDPASYYVFVLYTDAAGKKRKERLFLNVKQFVLPS